MKTLYTHLIFSKTNDVHSFALSIGLFESHLKRIDQKNLASLRSQRDVCTRTCPYCASSMFTCVNRIIFTFRSHHKFFCTICICLRLSRYLKEQSGYPDCNIPFVFIRVLIQIHNVIIHRKDCRLNRLGHDSNRRFDGWLFLLFLSPPRPSVKSYIKKQNKGIRYFSF